MWITVDEKKVRHCWECPECNYRVYVQPWFYSEMGTPVCTECEWDDEMEYIRTEILE
jgi:peptide subunit release factor 1 (eRF1)